MSVHDPSATACWIWQQLPPSERRARLRALYEWVTWLKATYSGERLIYPCWYQHPFAREELKDLWVAWIRTYNEPGNGALAMPYWQDARERVMHRIKTNLDEAGCTSHNHKPPHQGTAGDSAPGSASRPGPSQEELFTVWLASDPWATAPAGPPGPWQDPSTSPQPVADLHPADQQDQLDLEDPNL